MHELALMAELRRIAEQEARAEGATRLHRLRLRVGHLAGVDPEALRLAFAVVMADLEPTATLDLEVVPTVCFCSDCDQEFTPTDVIHACPRCGTLAARILRGRELELVALEVS